MAIEVNVTADDNVFLGTDLTIPFTITNAAGGVQDISGWSLEWVWKRALSDAAAVLSKTTVSGIVLTTPLSGLCTVTIADTDTDALHPRAYHHTCRRTDAGSEAVLAFGTWVWKKAA